MSSSTLHERFIRHSHSLAVQAAEKGNEPFGALLVHDGEVLLEAENTVNTGRDVTRHAELNLVVEAMRRLPPETLKASTLYASTAPCIMCSEAIRRAGITRVVYSVSYEAAAARRPGKPRFMPIEEVYERFGTPLWSMGGVLEEEGLKVYSHVNSR